MGACSPDKKYSNYQSIPRFNIYRQVMNLYGAGNTQI
jgi:hypothetical protein